MKKNKNKLIALILALITLSGCTPKNTSNSNENISINKSATISGTLDAISEDTYIDDMIEAYCNTDETISSIEELDICFKEAKNNGDLRMCNKILYLMGNLIIKAKVACEYGIEIDDIYEIDYNIETDPEEQCAAYIDGKFIKSFNNEKGKYEYESFVLYGEGKEDISRLVINTRKACASGWQLDEVDQVYLAMIRALLYNEEVYNKKVSFYERNFIDSTLDETKFNDYKEYVKTLS